MTTILRMGRASENEETRGAPLREDDNWGPGQKADGTIDIFDEEELRKRLIQRKADDEAFKDYGES